MTEHVLDVPETPAQRRVRRLKRVVRNLAFLALTYGAVIGVARLLHRYVLYQPPSEAPAAALPEGAVLLTLQSADHVPVHALEFAGGPRTVVHFHGNAETADQNATLAHLLVKQGFSVLLVEYRGYGRSAGDGKPDERGLYSDAEAVFEELRHRGKSPADVVLWGQSLGGGVATEMAARGRGGRLVLVAPFTSTVAMAQSSVPFLPGSWVMADRFDNLGKAPGIAVPVLVAHGDSDTVIPEAQGKELAAAFPHGTFHEVGGGTHQNLYKNVSNFQALVDFAKAP